MSSSEIGLTKKLRTIRYTLIRPDSSMNYSISSIGGMKSRPRRVIEIKHTRALEYLVTE